MRSIAKRMALFSAGILVICICCPAAFGQKTCKDAGISKVSVYDRPGTVSVPQQNAPPVSVAYDGYIQVTLDHGVTAADNLEQIGRWRAMAVTPTIAAPVPQIVAVKLKPPLSTTQSAPTFFINVYYHGTFETSKTYLIYIDGMTFDGCDPGSEVFATMSRETPPPQPPAPNTNSPYGLGKADDRDGSDLYVSGAIEGARHGKAVKTIDLKLAIPIAVKVFQNGNILSPYVDLKTSSDKSADADSLNIGAVLTSGVQIGKKGFFRSLVWDLDGHLEGNKNLKFINGVISNKLYFTTKVFEPCKTSCSLYIQPFLGYEFGRNLRTPVDEARGQKISRPIVGASAYLSFDIKKPLLDSISIQSNYTRRWSLTSEVGVDKDDDKYVPVFAGRGPRDYVQNKIEFGFNDYFGFTINYEYGSLPPNFNFLDHKFSAGLTFKSLLLKRPK